MKLRRVKLLAAVCCVLWTMASAAAEPSLAELLAEPVPQAANDGIEVAPPAEEDIQAPEGGWGWDELARRAGQRADEAKVQFIRAAAKRQQLDGDLSWKDPQLRLGQSWDDTRDRTTGRPPANGDGDSFKAGLRFYIANPFVNRYVRRAGDARIEALEQEVATLSRSDQISRDANREEAERLERIEQRRREEEAKRMAAFAPEDAEHGDGSDTSEGQPEEQSEEQPEGQPEGQPEETADPAGDAGEAGGDGRDSGADAPDGDGDSDGEKH